MVRKNNEWLRKRNYALIDVLFFLNCFCYFNILKEERIQTANKLKRIQDKCMPTDKTLVSFRSISKEKKNSLRVFLFSPCYSFYFFSLLSFVSMDDVFNCKIYEAYSTSSG